MFMILNLRIYTWLLKRLFVEFFENLSGESWIPLAESSERESRCHVWLIRSLLRTFFSKSDCFLLVQI